MSAKPSALKSVGWTVLSVGLCVAGVFIAWPYVRSEALGVIWPSMMRVLLAAVLVLIGLSASRRAGRLQYVCYLALALCFAIYVAGMRLVLEAAGVGPIA